MKKCHYCGEEFDEELTVAGLRAPDIIVRSAERLGCYTGMDTVKIDVGDISAAQAAGRISEIVKGSR